MFFLYRRPGRNRRQAQPRSINHACSALLLRCVTRGMPTLCAAAHHLHQRPAGRRDPTRAAQHPPLRVRAAAGRRRPTRARPCCMSTPMAPGPMASPRSRRAPLHTSPPHAGRGTRHPAWTANAPRWAAGQRARGGGGARRRAASSLGAARRLARGFGGRADLLEGVSGASWGPHPTYGGARARASCASPFPSADRGLCLVRHACRRPCGREHDAWFRCGRRRRDSRPDGKQQPHFTGWWLEHRQQVFCRLHGFVWLPCSSALARPRPVLPGLRTQTRAFGATTSHDCSILAATRRSHFLSQDCWGLAACLNMQNGNPRRSLSRCPWGSCEAPAL